MNNGKIIYALCEPDTNDVRYIGSTWDLGGRIKQHLNISKTDSNKGKVEWIRSLIEKGLKPNVIIIDTSDDNFTAEECERMWVDHYFKRGANLLNKSLIKRRKEKNTKRSNAITKKAFDKLLILSTNNSIEASEYITNLIGYAFENKLRFNADGKIVSTAYRFNKKTA